MELRCGGKFQSVLRRRLFLSTMRGVYVARVNHLGVISRPLAPTDITAIDCDLLPNVV